MTDFVEVVGLEPLLNGASISWKGRNFEDLYDEIARSPSRAEVREGIEDKVNNFFSSLRLPDETNVYDYLLLTLREKDVVATFNWDPFLLQAYRRHRGIRRLPHLLFLHGNVGIGVCHACRRKGLAGDACSKCGRELQTPRLLYPVRDKDYASDGFIEAEWKELRWYLERAYFLTIFGYSAPRTDAVAIELMRSVWDQNRTKELAQVEFVDLRPEEELVESWKPFLVRQHYSVTDTFMRSYLAWHPRRSCEALAFATLQNDPWQDNWMPTFTFPTQVEDWVAPLVKEEDELERAEKPLSGDPCPPL